MKVGDVVVNREGPFSTRGGALRSGCEHYTHAICVSLEPFALVSQGGDMLWMHQEPRDFVALCEASPAASLLARGRWIQEQRRRDATPSPVADHESPPALAIWPPANAEDAEAGWRISPEYLRRVRESMGWDCAISTIENAFLYATEIVQRATDGAGRDGWILVADRLPQVTVVVFVTDVGMRWMASLGGDGNWRDSRDGEVCSPPTYWQPLPKLPRVKAGS